MTSIKPPTGPSTTLPHTGVDLSAVVGGGAGDLEGAASPAPATGAQSAVGVQSGVVIDARGVDHGSALAGAPLGRAEQAGSAGQASLVELARAVERGQLSMAQAVDQLVESTVGSLPGKLTELERAELSELLRQALASDPTLSALRNEQGG